MANTILNKTDKRISRSQIIIDEDDLHILWRIPDSYIVTISLEDIKKFIKLSNKGLSLHMKRLKSLDLIREVRNEKNHRFKMIGLTSNGQDLKKNLLNIPKLKKLINDKIQNGN